MENPQGFWAHLKKPIMALAPMANVTDAAFRQVIAKCGKPDIMWTEFVSADGLLRARPEGKAKILKDLIFTEAERPIVAQFFTGSPEIMEHAAAAAREMGFDGIDINMGCPDKTVEKQGGGAALIKTPARAREIIKAAKRGAKHIPVSVKTRLGYNRDELETWLPELLAENPVAITIHARTRKEMSKVPAKWNRIADAVKIRNNLKSETLILGNGDVLNIEDAKIKAEQTLADGIMLGRAIFGNPWLFAAHGGADISQSEKLEVLAEHIKLFNEILGQTKSFAVMKKHFKAYINGFGGAAELRALLMATASAEEAVAVIHAVLKKA